MSTVIDGSAGITTNAGGSVNPSTNIDGINYSCRAWVNFNGTGTVAMRASGNVTNITDNGTGDYTVNFTNAMSDANYSVVGLSSGSGSAISMFSNISGAGATSVASNTNNITIQTRRMDGISGVASLIDAPYNYIAIFR